MGKEGSVLEGFQRDGSGSWLCIAPVTLQHELGRIQFTPGARFRRGEMFMGVDVAAWLDEQASALR